MKNMNLVLLDHNFFKFSKKLNEYQNKYFENKFNYILILKIFRNRLKLKIINLENFKITG